jgi:hypothetical protein
MSDALSSRNGVDGWNLDPDTVHLLINKQFFEPFFRSDKLKHVNTELSCSQHSLVAHRDR